MEKFCSECGTKKDEVTGLCPKCEAERKAEKKAKKEAEKQARKEQKKQEKKERKKKKKQEKKAAKKEKWKQLTFGQKVRKLLLKMVLWIVLAAVLLGGILGIFTYWGVIDVPCVSKVMNMIGIESGDKEVNEEKPSEDDELNTDEEADTNNKEESYVVESPDVKEYFSDNAQIVSEIDAESSKDTYTEAEAWRNLEDRGFVEYQITTEYTMDGSYNEGQEISDNSTEKHPLYETFYFSQSGDIWRIFLINGEVMANPVTYNMQSGLEVQVIISEKETVTSYDSKTNKFYETIPEKDALIVITVDAIDGETLDSLTIGEIDKYV